MKLEFFKGLDMPAVFTLMLIQVIGLIGVFSATYKGSLSPLFVKQFLYVLYGWLIILFALRVNFRIVYDLSTAIYMFNLFLLILVPLFGKGVYGAKRWLDIGPVNLQPSEFMKFSLLLFITYTLTHTKKALSKESLIVILSFLMPVFLTLKQPDLGTSICYSVILASLLFLKGVRLRFFFLSAFFLLLLSPFIWHFLKGYQKERILALLDPYSDYSGSGYQLIQSIIAVGSGGLMGKGFLKGTQSHLLFLPEKHTDFMFSVIAEEWGFWLSAFLISAYLFLIYRLVSFGKKVYDDAERLFLGGVASLFIFQVFVNLMMTMGFMPVVGIPIPFVSYGGSSIITFSLALGVCLSIIREYKLRKIYFEYG
ncbi:MAG: rod shape-determining protein RodA [Aquificaceae bacterium]